MGARLQLRGLSELNQALRTFQKRAPAKVMLAAVTVVEEIMTDSRENFVPFRDGILKSSGFIDIRKSYIEFGYGGAAEAYAVIQHENEAYRHAVGGAKYLERPLFKAVPGFNKRLAEIADFDSSPSTWPSSGPSGRRDGLV